LAGAYGNLGCTVPNAIFNLTPVATVDEGNNWINISWGPLALAGPSGQHTGMTPDAFLGNYTPASATSPTVNFINNTGPNNGSGGPYRLAPDTDFFGNARKTNNAVDAGAVEFQGAGGGGGAVTVSPTSLAFGNWAAGTTSNPLLVTVTNSGATSATGGAQSITPGQFSRVTTGAFPAGAPNCAGTLAAGASCTIKVAFAAPAAGAPANFAGSLAVVYNGVTVTGSPVALSGSSVVARGTVSITPNPLTITVPAGALSRTGTVTLTNTAAAGGSSVAVNSVGVSGSGLIWIFTKGTDNCTGANLAPGATCTVGVTFSRFGSVGTHTGAITFTDTATGSPQSGVLTGVAQ
jgi:hypothetical protein